MTDVAWHAAGAALATRLLGARVSPYRLADLPFRHALLLRHHGAALRALDAPAGREHEAPGQWVRHVDGAELHLTAARAAAERAFCAGWDQVVDGVIRQRTATQRLPGEGTTASPEADADATALAQLGLPRDCTEDEVKRAFRAMALGAHPDTGGDHDLFLELGRARDRALAWVDARDALRKRTKDG